MSTKYLSVKEVAVILRIHIKTVYKIIYEGNLPGHFKLGSMHFVDEEEFRGGLKKLATNSKQASSQVSRNFQDRHGLLK